MDIHLTIIISSELKKPTTPHNQCCDFLIVHDGYTPHYHYLKRTEETNNAPNL